MLIFAHLEFQVFIGQVLGLSVNSLELTKTHGLLNGVLDLSMFSSDYTMSLSNISLDLDLVE